MLVFGVYGALQFLVGLALYALGAIAAWYKLPPIHLRQLAALHIGLLLFNFAFYASVPVLPLVDLSLAVYMLLLLGLGGIALRLRFLTQTPLWFPLRFLVAAFLVATGLSFLSAAHLKEVVYFVGMTAAGIACWYLVANVLRGDFRGGLWVLRTAFWLGALSSLSAVWQLYSESFKVFYFPYLDARDQAIMQLWEQVSRVVGTWQHPSYLGMYLAMMLPVGVYLLLRKSATKREKLLVWLGLVVIGAVLLLTNTRSSALAGSLGAILVLAFFSFRRSPQPKGPAFVARFSFLALAVAAGMLLYQFVFVSEIYSKPQAYRVDASATIWGRFLRADSMSTESLVQRSELYKLAWQEFSAHPLTGIGAKNFSYAVEAKFGQGTDAHNVFLQFLAETGIFGVLGFLALFLGLLWSMFFRLLAPADPEVRSLRFVLFVELLLVLFDSQFNNPLFSLRLVGVFWILIGLFYALSVNNEFLDAKAYD